VGSNLNVFELLSNKVFLDYMMQLPLICSSL